MTVARLDDYRASPAPARPLPVNVEAEQALLGAVLVNNAAWHAIGPRLKAEHFAEELHGQIWTVISERVAAGALASPLTVKTWLPEGEVAPGLTVPAYLARLAAEATTVVNAPDYARLVVDLAARRSIIAAAQEVVDVAYDAPVGHAPQAILDAAEASLMALRLAGLVDDKGTRVTAGDAAGDLLAEVDRIMAGEAKAKGVTTGIPDLDGDTGGMTAGDLWVVAGRASMGKTVKATSLAHAAAGSGAGTLLFPFEIGRRQAAARILADLAYRRSRPIGYGAILRGEVDREDRWCLEDARKRLGEMPLVIDDASRGTLGSIAARVRSERERMARRGTELKVVILDYLKFIRASDRYKGQRHYEVGEITVGLKEIAKDLGVCVVLLAQVNRQTESRDDKRPNLSDLRESGDIETDADVVAFVYREIYYVEKSAAYLKGDPDALAKANDVRNELELIVGKNRVGPTRTHRLWCDVGASKISPRHFGGA